MPHDLTCDARTDWPPKVWAVLCYRAGDNSQILALAESLGWPFEVKRLAYRKSEVVLNLLRGTGLAGIVKGKSSPLVQPWPDLVISASWRNEPVCRWIQKQARKVNKKVRYIHVGRPWAGLHNFNLVIATPEFRMARRPNVLHNAMSLQRITEPRLAQAALAWAPRLAHLPRPHIAVLIGGYSGPYVLDHEKAERLGRQASAMASNAGGSLLVTTSARTPRSSIQSLAAVVSAPMHLFRWAPNAAENPYHAYLALADSIIVTGDSASMLAEACATRKPVHIFDLGDGVRPTRPSLSGEEDDPRAYRQWQRLTLDHAKALLYRQMMRIPPRRLTRDIGLVHQFLISSGRAVWLGERLPSTPPPPLDDTKRAVARVHALFDVSVDLGEVPQVGEKKKLSFAPAQSWPKG